MIVFLLCRAMLTPTQITGGLETWDLPLGLREKLMVAAGCHSLCEQPWRRSGWFFGGFHRDLLTADSGNLGSPLGSGREPNPASALSWGGNLSVFFSQTFSHASLVSVPHLVKPTHFLKWSKSQNFLQQHCHIRLEDSIVSKQNSQRIYKESNLRCPC